MASSTDDRDRQRTEVLDSARMPTVPGRWQVRSSLGGGIFGATLWLLILAGLVDDWVSVGAIVGGDVALLLATMTIVRRRPQRYWTAAFLMVCGVMVITLTAVNLRWAAWMRAYPESGAFEPTNDVSLTTVNLVILAAFSGLFVLFGARYVRSRRQARVEQG